MSEKAPTGEDYNRLHDENVGLRRGMRELQEELEKKGARLRHLLQSETIQAYDELIPRTSTYQRDIRELDILIHGMAHVLRHPQTLGETVRWARPLLPGESEEEREKLAEALGRELLAAGFIEFSREVANLKTGDGQPVEILTAYVRAIKPNGEEAER